jgi:ADP-ribose pyrophosphatase YjhB (NUDIX family)
MSAPLSVDALDVARDYMRAFNRADRDALVALYVADATFEAPAPIWPDEIAAAPGGDAADSVARDTRAASTAGHDVVRSASEAAVTHQIAWFFDTYDGGFAGGTFFEVRTIARIETGWTHVEWAARLRNRVTGELAAYQGYFHFLIRDGRISQQRGVAHLVAAASIPTGGNAAAAAASGATGAGSAASEPAADGAAPRSSRVYPSRPIVGVGGVIIQDGQVVLIKRKFEPLAGQWSLPGGSLEVGETLEAGVAREMLEETGLVVDVGPVIDVFDRILLDADQKVRFHFVLIDYLCIPRGGELRADSDVVDAVLVDPNELAPYKLTPKAADVIRKAFLVWRQPSDPPSN